MNKTIQYVKIHWKIVMMGVFMIFLSYKMISIEKKLNYTVDSIDNIESRLSSLETEGDNSIADDINTIQADVDMIQNTVNSIEDDISFMKYRHY